MKRITALFLAALMLMSLTTALAQDAAAPAKYVFFFIGDGMSNVQTTAAQYFLGTQQNADSETPVQAPLSFTGFPVAGQMFTYDATSFAPDSASTASAMSTGNRILSGSINVGYKAGEKGLEPDAEQPYKIVTEYAKEAGMQVGVITSVSLDHATPAAYYAKAPSRGAYYDIAVQGLTGGAVDFLGGGGYLQPTGKEIDQKDVLEIAVENGFTVYNTNEDIRALENNEKGFFMMVEGGKIDWAGHANDVGAVVHDVFALADAVQVAVDFAQKHPEDTLIVVTGDHETGGMTIGYAETGYDIRMDYLQNQKLSYVAADALINALEAPSFDDVLALIQENYGLTKEEGQPLSLTARDISRLSAAYTFGMLPSAQRKGVTGPEEQLHYGGYNPLSVTASHILANKAGINFASYAHTGVSLPVYAVGAGAELFGGNYENTEMFANFMEAMGLSK